MEDAAMLLQWTAWSSVDIIAHKHLPAMHRAPNAPSAASTDSSCFFADDVLASLHAEFLAAIQTPSTMADDINIDPALSHPPSSVVSDLTPLASPALSPFPPSRPPSRLNGLVSRHGSPDIVVPATHVHIQNNDGSNAGSTTASHSNSISNSTDVPVPQQQSTSASTSQPSSIPKQASTAGVKRKVDDSTIMRCPYRESKKCRKEYKHKNGESALL